MNGSKVTGTFTSDATVEAEDIVSGKTAYVNGEKVTEALTYAEIITGTVKKPKRLSNIISALSAGRDRVGFTGGSSYVLFAGSYGVLTELAQMN